jgi:hypothetical protein
MWRALVVVFAAAAAAAPGAEAATPKKCELPSDANVIARSAKVVFWRSGHTYFGCRERKGDARELFDLRPDLHERLRILHVFLRGERIVLAARWSGYDFEEEKDYDYTSLEVIRLDEDLGPGLDSGFGDVTELQGRRGRFAWVTTARKGSSSCPCTVRAGTGSQSFVVARRDVPIEHLRFDGATVGFDSAGESEQTEVPFARPRRFDPMFGGTRARFELSVRLPEGIPTGGKLESFFYETANWGRCHYPWDPHRSVTAEGRTLRLAYYRANREWCRGTYRIRLIYRWGHFGRWDGAKSVGACGPAEYNCAGEVALGHVALHVRRNR